MATLTPGKEVIFVVDGEWYREMVKQGMLPAGQAGGRADVLPGKFKEQTYDGYWIDLPPELAQLPDPAFFVPARFVLGVGIADFAEVKKRMGFAA